jgi:Acetyltransferase (GNAT) domain
VDAPDFGSLPRLTINLGAGDTPDPHCTFYVDELYPVYTRHMGSQYPGYSRLGTGTSVAVLPDTYEQWFQDVGKRRRRKVRLAQQQGYEFRRINRDDYLDDIYEVNTSLEERQGREMAPRYRRKVNPFGPLPEHTCPRHQLCTYGVLKDGKLVAYAWIYQTGEMFLLSTLLGHGEHLNEGIMFLLIAGVIEDLIRTAGSKYAVYERHWSGTEGLRFFKEQMGFKPYMVTFVRGDERPPTPREKIAAALTARVERAQTQARRWRTGARRRTSRLRTRGASAKRRLRRRLGRVKRRVQARFSPLRQPGTLTGSSRPGIAGRSSPRSPSSAP